MREKNSSDEKSRFATEGIVLEKLVAGFRIGVPVITYSELKESMDSFTGKNLNEALENLTDHSIIYSSDGESYSIAESGLSEFERRKNAGLLF